MLRFHADVFVSASNSLQRSSIIIRGDSNYLKDKIRLERDIILIDWLIEQLQVLNLPVTRKRAQTLKNLLTSIDPNDNPASKALVAIEYIEELLERLADELDGRFVYMLSGKAHLVDSTKSLFGDAVDNAFPAAVEDISEAGKCLALGRATASVFHLMRVMECAVQVLSAKLGTVNIDKEWGKLLSEMSAKIEAMPKGEERDQWSESHSHLYHVKQAWRNSTMHPKKTYTEEEADAVFAAVRSFMRHLANLA